MPDLSGEVKASAVKVLLRFLAEVALDVWRQEALQPLRALACGALALFTHTLDHSPAVMTEGDIVAASDAAEIFLRAYQHLAAGALRDVHPLWRLRPKFHYFTEAVKRMRRTRENPLHCMCFMEEDFMGKIKRIACKTHRGNQSMRTLQRYQWLLQAEGLLAAAVS